MRIRTAAMVAVSSLWLAAPSLAQQPPQITTTLLSPYASSNEQCVEKSMPKLDAAGISASKRPNHLVTINDPPYSLWVWCHRNGMALVIVAGPDTATALKLRDKVRTALTR